MGETVCCLCRANAQVDKEVDQGTKNLLTNVDCPECGPYVLTPQAWTSHERSCLAAYVSHENQAKRRPPLIQSTNWQMLVRLGEALRQKR
jgi:hypothetical protein